MIAMEDLLKKKDLLDIDYKANPSDVYSIIETPEHLMSRIAFEGSPQLQTRLKAMVHEFIDIFATNVDSEPTAVEPIKMVVVRDNWRLPCNRAPPWKHTEGNMEASGYTVYYCNCLLYQGVTGGRWGPIQFVS